MTEKVDTRLSYVIGALGWIINIIYFGYEYLEEQDFVAHFLEAPLEHSIIVSMVPVFSFMGYEWRTGKILKGASQNVKYLIGSLGWILNTGYYTLEWTRFGIEGVIIHVFQVPIEHFLILSMGPIFMLLGDVWRTEQIIEHFKRHFLKYAIGAIGWAVNIIYFAHDVRTYGTYAASHIIALWPEHLTIVSMIPLFMLIGFLMDVRRVHTEEEITLLHEAVEGSPTMILITDLNGTIKYVNHAALNNFLYRREEFIGKDVSTLNVDQALGKTSIARTIEDELWGDRVAYKKKDGTVFEALVSSSLVKDEFGSPIAILKTARDLSRELVIVDKLDESEARYKSLFDKNPSPLYVLDGKGKFVETNQAFTDLTGYKMHELAGKSVEDLFSKREQLKILQYYHEKIKHKERPFEYELPIVRKDGTERIVRVRANINLQGKFAVGAMDDITERKKMEAQLKEYTEQLEQRVEKRTEELKLERDKLNDTVKRLAWSNSVKDLFTDIMRHDLLNPAGIINSYAELLMEEEAMKSCVELQSIKRNTEKMIEMIEDASRLSKLESSDKLVFERTDVNKMLKGVIENLDKLIAEKKMKVEYEEKGECIVNANTSIENVFSNLLSNAIKYSPTGSKISIGVEKDDENCMVFVKDRGEGILDENKKLVFERFERGGKKGVKGTGLGLAIVKRIVDLHHGKVWVEDNPEGGSIFYVTIPNEKT